MIFVGRGALLGRAVRSALASGHRVDLVCVPPGEPQTAAWEAAGVRVLVTEHVNAAAPILLDACSDGVGWSINNPVILRGGLLDSGVRFYNIHNGPLPAYRGIPEVAVVHAILRGEQRYAGTLHRVDAGIDTGEVLDVEEFPIADDDGFAEVMMHGLRACHTLFERNVGRVLRDDVQPSAAAIRAADRAAADGVRAGYYGRPERAALAEFADHPRFARATAFGVFTPHVADLADLTG